ncbi:hypothetical protein AB1484_16840 [Parafrankia sp. FMc6]|uniref:hypothetical protein n=1 Tax=Parafrankia soli TaxID=2599596 RepID=UPI0034D72149
MPAAMRRRIGVAACAAASAWLLVGAVPAWSSTGRGTERHTEATGTSDPALGRIEAMAGTTAVPDTDGGAGTEVPDLCEWFPADLYLYLEAETSPTERTAPDGTREVLYARVCDPAEVTYHWVRDDTGPAQAVALAMAVTRERIPAPEAVFVPDLDGGATAFARAPIRFGISNGGPVTASASVPGVTATVTATPRRLEFIPGDGSPPTGCDAPASAAGQPAAACTYTYRDASTVAPNGQAWPARLRVEWAVWWSATTGTGGALPPITTTADHAVPVREIQALEHAD